MTDYFVCFKDCTFAGQRWYPGDKMPMSYVKGNVPKYFTEPAAYKKMKEAEAEARHDEEVKNKMDAMRTTDPLITEMTQAILNKNLGKKKIKQPETPLGENWKHSTIPITPKVAGPQPGSLIIEKRGPGRPPKNIEDD